MYGKSVSDRLEDWKRRSWGSQRWSPGERECHGIALRRRETNCDDIVALLINPSFEDNASSPEGFARLAKSRGVEWVAHEMTSERSGPLTTTPSRSSRLGWKEVETLTSGLEKDADQDGNVVCGNTRAWGDENDKGGHKDNER